MTTSENLLFLKKNEKKIFELIISSIQNSISLWSLLLIAVSTIYWPCTIWFKRYLGFLSTFCTCYIVHFSRGAIIAAPSSVVIHIILPYFYIEIFQFWKTLSPSTNDHVYKGMYEFKGKSSLKEVILSSNMPSLLSL